MNSGSLSNSNFTAPQAHRAVYFLDIADLLSSIFTHVNERLERHGLFPSKRVFNERQCVAIVRQIPERAMAPWEEHAVVVLGIWRSGVIASNQRPKAQSNDAQLCFAQNPASCSRMKSVFSSKTQCPHCSMTPPSAEAAIALAQSKQWSPKEARPAQASIGTVSFVLVSSAVCAAICGI